MRDYEDELMDYEGDAEDRYDDYDYEDEHYEDEDSFDTASKDRKWIMK